MLLTRQKYKTASVTGRFNGLERWGGLGQPDWLAEDWKCVETGGVEVWEELASDSELDQTSQFVEVCVAVAAWVWTGEAAGVDQGEDVGFKFSGHELQAIVDIKFKDCDTLEEEEGHRLMCDKSTVKIICLLDAPPKVCLCRLAFPFLDQSSLWSIGAEFERFIANRVRTWHPVLSWRDLQVFHRHSAHRHWKVPSSEGR